MQIGTMTMPETLSRLQKHFIGSDNFFGGGGLWNDTTGFPPYNIEKITPESYKLTLALAGYGKDDISISVEGSTLVIKGSKTQEEIGQRVFLHQGIAERDFKREFRLMENTVVSGANFDNGLLHIDIRYEIPEVLKPRQIEIK